MNSKNILDALEAVDDKFILEAKEHKTMKKKTHWVRRIAICVAAVLVLSIATVGTAMAVNEDFRITMYRSVGKSAIAQSLDMDMGERAKIYDFPNKVEAWLADEHGVKGEDIGRKEWSEEEGIYIGIEPNGYWGSGGVVLTDGELYVVRHTWTGFKLSEHLKIERPAEGETMTIGMVSTKEFTAVYGWMNDDPRFSKTVVGMDGVKHVVNGFYAVQLSDNAICELQYYGYQNNDCGKMFLAVAWGDHRGAEVVDLVNGTNIGITFEGHTPTEEDLERFPMLRPEITERYTEIFGALPEITVTK